MDWKRELTIAVGLFGLGILVLPFAIYWVGSALIGEYAPDASAMTLAERIWSDLLAFDGFAWLLALSPYLIVVTLRLLRRAWRPRTV
jgi:hypothetical protein